MRLITYLATNNENKNLARKGEVLAVCAIKIKQKLNCGIGNALSMLQINLIYQMVKNSNKIVVVERENRIWLSAKSILLELPQ